MSRNVYVVDDDEQVRRSLGFVLRTAGFAPTLFDSGEAFRVAQPGLPAGCVLLDVRMPGIDGMSLLEALTKSSLPWPVIMMTGHGDVPMAVKAIKNGAFDFLEKPFSDVQLVNLLHKGFSILVERSAEAGQRNDAKQKVNGLTKRESDVLQGLVNGLNNKLLARHLDLGIRTIETYRATMMTKLGASNVAEALQIAQLAGLKAELATAKSS